MKKRRRWLRVFAVAATAAPVLLLLSAFAYSRWEIHRIKMLAVIPTPKLEPENRASYYMDAAPLAMGPSDELLKALDGIDFGSTEASATVATLEKLISVNSNLFLRLEPARKLNTCRMPLLCSPGAWGQSEFQASDALRRTGDVLFCSTLLKLCEGKYVDACEDALLNLRFGRDVAMAGSNYQASSGLYIYRVASCSLGIALTQFRMDGQSLELLRTELPKSGLPSDFCIERIWESHGDWRRLAHEQRDPLYARILQSFKISLPRFRFSEPGLLLHGAFDANPLIHHAESSNWGTDSLDGLRSGLVLLQIGTAARSYSNDTGQMPTAIKDLVPKYLAATPADPTGAPFQESSGDSFFEIVSPGNKRDTAERRLRFADKATVQQP
jgi:hypothetical protein